MVSKKVNKTYKNFIKLFLLFLLFTSSVIAQRSKIEGTIKDAVTGEPLFGANVIILNTTLGAASDTDGNYFIINVPVGTYEIQASMIGYTKKVVVDVLVSADRVTKLNFELEQGAIEQEEVVVLAEKNILHKEVSSTQLVVTNEQIFNASGVRDINAFLEKQPGVSSSNGFLQIRGGSADQTGTFINGLSYNNAAVGNAETTIPLSAIEQVSLSAGGFNAEYGNFRSGLINVTTKSGSKEKYHGTITVSRNISHLKRFGPLLSDPLSPALSKYLDPRTAFTNTGSNDFLGWISTANTFNQSRLPNEQATPYDFYLLTTWMHMAEPDYAGLEGLPGDLKEQIGYYPISEEQRKLFAEHKRKEEGVDYNIDAGFGGPIPFISKYLGDATFYLSHTTKEEHYVAPVVIPSQNIHITMATIKSFISTSLTLSINGIWKRQLGVSPLKPAFGDTPDNGREGGFMPINNLRNFARLDGQESGTTNYWFDPPIFPQLSQTTVLGGITLNHVINNSTFWEFTANYSSIKDHSPVGDNRNNRVITTFGPFPVSEMPYGKLQFANNNRLVYINGTDTIAYTYPGYDAPVGVNDRRFRSKEGDLNTNVHTQQFKLKFDITSQIGSHHYLKSGIEYNRIDINHKMWLKWNRTGPYNTYEYNYHRIPSQTGFYIQDQVSYEGIVANLGVRLDYYYGGGGLWPTGEAFSTAFTSTFGGSPRNPGAAADSFYAILASGRSLIWEKWEEYNKEHPGFLQPVKNHLTVSPRLGLAFPVTVNSKFYFNYGHFRSNPPYFTMFLYKYRYDKEGLHELSDPNLEPPKTISYELGVTYNVYENIILTFSGYYKDVTGQVGDINYRTTSSLGLDYERKANNNYEDIKGLELNITKNDNSWITGWINFNYMLKKSGYTGREEYTDITDRNPTEGFFNGSEERFLPQPVVNANITLRSPSDLFGDNLLNDITSNWYMTIFAEYKAGEYFTFDPLEKFIVSNNLQWPDYYMVDLRLSKSIDILGLNTTFYVDISNVFNFKVNLLSEGYAFKRASNEDSDFETWRDFNDYLASLRLPMYASSEFDLIRDPEKGLYMPGDDEVGEMRSDEKPYINNPDNTYFIYGFPRDIWFGIRVNF